MKHNPYRLARSIAGWLLRTVVVTTALLTLIGIIYGATQGSAAAIALLIILGVLAVGLGAGFLVELARVAGKRYSYYEQEWDHKHRNETKG